MGQQKKEYIKTLQETEGNDRMKNYNAFFIRTNCNAFECKANFNGKCGVNHTLVQNNPLNPSSFSCSDYEVNENE